jgi:NAD(P)-dependent dehydrogenase (short-subunit alcohol dehydrogenase family)
VSNERIPGALILGARNLGGAITQHLLDEGWAVTSVARSDDTLEAVRDLGAHAIKADATSTHDLQRALREASARQGGVDLVVNAVAAYGGGGSGPFGGGPLADADVEAFEGWTAITARQAFVALSTAGHFLREQGRGGTIVQVTGGSARRASPGRGLWAAGAFAVRALTNAAALELREHGIHVVLLIVDATIESPKTAAYTRDAPADSLADMEEIARAVRFLAEQSPRGFTHELQITPAGERWVP